MKVNFENDADRLCRWCSRVVKAYDAQCPAGRDHCPAFASDGEES